MSTLHRPQGLTAPPLQVRATTAPSVPRTERTQIGCNKRVKCSAELESLGIGMTRAHEAEVLRVQRFVASN